jgi:sporulation-control protein spo0M
MQILLTRCLKVKSVTLYEDCTNNRCRLSTEIRELFGPFFCSAEKFNMVYNIYKGLFLNGGIGVLNNSMAELGCERPEVILKLDRNQIPAGETLSGSFVIRREFMERTDNAIEVDFVLKAQLEDEISEKTLDCFRSLTPRTAEDYQDDQIVEFPFQYQIPDWVPVSTHAIRYYVRPKLPLISKDMCFHEDFLAMEAIIVQPNREQTRLLQALNALGFQEKLDSRYWDGKVQEFDFVAGKSSNIGIQELTVLFEPGDEYVRVHIHADQREPVSLLLADEQDLAVSLANVLK